MLLTPLGPVEVQGTEFVTTVDYPSSFEGEQMMTAQTRRVVVTVAVLAGTVICQLGDGPTVLTQGTQRTFAGEKEDVKGVVASTTDFSLTLKVASGEEAVFYVPKMKKLTVQEVSQLRPGDEVGVIWIEEEGKKWIQDIVGKGVIVATVSGLGDRWIEVTAAGKDAQRFRPPWRGGNPSQGGGFDKEVLRMLGAVRVGDRVQLTWEIPEGKRVVDVKVLDRSRREEPKREGARGFSGTVEGKVVSVSGTQFVLAVEKVLRVWRENKAENPESLVGTKIVVAAKNPESNHARFIKTLKVDETISLEVKHEEGEALRILELTAEQRKRAEER
jgi:hypothetical protein